MIELQTYYPLDLSPFVKSFWCLKTGAGVYEEDILPDGHHEIIFHTNTHAAKRTSNEYWIDEPLHFFAGQTLTKYSLRLKPGSLLYGIRFYPYAITPLFHFPAAEITNKIIPLNAVCGTENLRSCITENTEQTFLNFEKVLTKRIYQTDFSSAAFNAVQFSVHQILQEKGSIKIDRLIKQTGFSARYFDSVFRNYVGINPKQFSSIIQLNHFISYKHNHPHKKLTECVYEAGFFDQSHLIRLFKHVTGKTPGAYFSSANYISNQFSDL